MGFYDGKGCYRDPGEGFYDSKGCYREHGEGFYDGRGCYREPGEGFYDSRGCYREPGEDFYDGKGYVQSSVGLVAAPAPSMTGAVLAVGFLLSLPIIALWTLGVSLIEQIGEHPYLVFLGYALFAMLICYVVTRKKRHHGAAFAMSFTGNYLSILSLVYVVLLYAIPCVLQNEGSFGSFFEFTVTVLFGIGAIVILQFFNYYHEKALLEFLLGVAFFVVVAFMLRQSAGTLESISQIYHLENAELFRWIVGFMLAE